MTFIFLLMNDFTVVEVIIKIVDFDLSMHASSVILSARSPHNVIWILRFLHFLVILSLFSLFDKFPIISIKKSFESNEPFVFNLNDPSLQWLSIFVILIHRENGWHSSNNIYIIYMIKYIKDIQLDFFPLIKPFNYMNIELI